MIFDKTKKSINKEVIYEIFLLFRFNLKEFIPLRFCCIYFLFIITVYFSITLASSTNSAKSNILETYYIG